MVHKFVDIFFELFQHRNGEVVERRTRQTKSANNIEGHSEELWEPKDNQLTDGTGN